MRKRADSPPRCRDARSAIMSLLLRTARPEFTRNACLTRVHPRCDEPRTTRSGRVAVNLSKSWGVRRAHECECGRIPYADADAGAGAAVYLRPRARGVNS